MTEIVITTFDGDQSVADAVAAHHLAVRFQQRADGESDFHGRIHSSQADLKDMENYYLRPGGNFFIARDTASDEIAGFVGLKKIGLDEGQIKRMAVLPGYRRQRMGTRLAEAAVAWAIETDFEKLQVATGDKEHAIHIYKSVGFVVVGHDDVRGDHLLELNINRRIASR